MFLTFRLLSLVVVGFTVFNKNLYYLKIFIVFVANFKDISNIDSFVQNLRHHQNSIEFSA